MSSSAASLLQLAGAACVAAALFGCTSWNTFSGADVERLSTVVQIGDTVRATTAASGTLELKVTSFDEGLLSGVTPDGTAVQIRATDLTTLDYRVPSRRKTFWLVIGAVLGAALIDAYDSCKPKGPWGAPACSD